SLEHQLDGRLDGSLVVEDPERFVRPDELLIGKIPAKTACMTESLRFRQIGFPGKERLVQIPKRAGRLVEDLAEMGQLVSAGDGYAVVKLAAPQRFRSVHQAAERLGNAARDADAEERGEHQREDGGHRNDENNSPLRQGNVR